MFVIILSSFLVVNAATDARFLFLCCCVGDGFIIVVVVLDRLFSFVLLLLLDRVEVAKAIEEEERNIGVAFILPFTLTCVCVCVCVCLCLHHRVYEDRVWLGLFTHEQNRRGKISFFRSFFFCFVGLHIKCTHYNKREKKREKKGERRMMSTFCSMISFQTSTRTRRANVNDHGLFPRFSGAWKKKMQKTSRRIQKSAMYALLSIEVGKQVLIKRRREVLLAQTLGAATVLITISGAAVAADAGDVVLIDAPEGYAYDSSQIRKKESRKVWSDDESILKEKSGVNYRIEFPERFAALTDVNSARVVGVDCSFKDPRDEASTLAIFINTLPSNQRTLKDAYDSLDTKAKQMALSAKNQRTKRKEKYTKQGIGEAWEIETEVGGGTAGRFGAAVELISLFVINEKVEVTVRATASLSSWKKVRKELRECVRSFELV